MYKFLLALCFICCWCSVSAQLKWKLKGPLYEDDNFAVEIEYAEGSDPCIPGSMPWQYRYKVTRHKGLGRYLIQWRYDYFDCNHQLKTHLNTLEITKTRKPGYIIPDDNQFFALRLVNYFNAVKKVSGLPEATVYTPESPTSMEPKAITGKTNLKVGDSTTLSLLGGYLASNSRWQWYEGECKGKLIGTGTALTVKPQQTTVYAVSAEGEHATPCVLIRVNVPDVSVAAARIDGRPQLCEGERNARLTVAGGKLAPSAKWIWYQGQCGGRRIGEGNSIEVSPDRTTTYLVRAEGPGGPTECREFTLTVAGKSIAADWIDGADKVAGRSSFVLSVHGGQLAADANWVWYAGTVNNRLRLGTGSSWHVNDALSDQAYWVRAEGACYNSEFVFKTVRISHARAIGASSPAVSHITGGVPVKYFINGGVVVADISQLDRSKNFVVTLGGGKKVGWFIRAKISASQNKAAFQTAGTQVSNYNLPGFYQYNARTVSKRSGYTGGVYLGGRHIAVYLGGGYGQRELLYGIDQYNYGNALYIQSAWVKHAGYSYSGAEAEGGLILKTGSFNLMGGVSTIQGKYTDYHLGIGLNF